MSKAVFDGVHYSSMVVSKAQKVSNGLDEQIWAIRHVQPPVTEQDC